MINKRAFSILNIIIFVCVAILGGMVIKKYFINQSQNYGSNETEDMLSPVVQPDSSIKRDYVSSSIVPDISEESVNNKNKASALPDPSTLPTITAKTFNQATMEEVAPLNTGYFENEKYNYSIAFPKEWNLKNEQVDNISIGYIPPKDGIGSMSIRIGDNVDSEIASLKKELKQYSGMVSLTEDSVNVASEKAQRLILTNLLNNTKNYYLIFSHNSTTYVIKYSHQSDKFVQEVETVLNNFKFTDK